MQGSFDKSHKQEKATCKLERREHGVKQWFNQSSVSNRCDNSSLLLLYVVERVMICLCGG